MEIAHVAGAGKVLAAIYLHAPEIAIIVESAYLVNVYAKLAGREALAIRWIARTCAPAMGYVRFQMYLCPYQVYRLFTC